MTSTSVSARLSRWLPSAREGGGALLLGPGLWLMRHLRARAKVSLLLAMFAVPLIGLTVLQLHGEWRQMQRVERTLLGLRAALGLGELGQLAYDRRVALLAGRTPAATLDEVARQLAEVQSRLDALAASGMPVPASWARLRDTVAPLTQGPQAGSEARPWQDVLVQHLQVRTGVLRDAGVLAVNDPEGPQLALLSQQDLPEAAFQLALLRPAAMALAAARDAQPRDEVRVARQAGQLAMQAGRMELLVGRAELGLKTHPIAGAVVELGKVPPLMSAVRAVVLSPQAFLDMNELLGQIDAAMDELKTVRRQADEAFTGELQRSQAQARRNALVLAAVLAVAMLLSGYLGLCYVLALLRGFERVQSHLTAMADGDFSHQARVQGRDEVADALLAINRSFSGVGELLALVQQSVGAIHHAGAQMANGNAELTERNRRAMQSLQDVVEGVARYASQLEACGKQVESVVGTVQALRMDAVRNRKQMQRLQERMHELRGKSREISQIVGLIDGIAFRTNILALNASIEASKAGDAGRGFAVVALEVRTLALRSAESARRIGDIVTRSTEDIELSGALADEAGRTLTASDVHVDRIHAAIEDVATLTRGGEQQSAAILGEVRKLSEDTQRNTTLVEQLAQASESLQGQGQVLVERVERFKLS